MTTTPTPHWAQELTEEDLDEMVYDVKVKEASEIINRGKDAQIKYLELTRMQSVSPESLRAACLVMYYAGKSALDLSPQLLNIEDGCVLLEWYVGTRKLSVLCLSTSEVELVRVYSEDGDPAEVEDTRGQLKPSILFDAWEWLYGAS